MAAEIARKGLAGALAKAILRLLDTFMAMLADFNAGLLVPPPRPSPARAGEGEDARVAGIGEAAGGACAAGSIPLVKRWIRAPAQAAGRLFAGLTGFAGNADRGADAGFLGAPGGEDRLAAEDAESGSISLVERWIPASAGMTGIGGKAAPRTEPAYPCAPGGEGYSTAESAEWCRDEPCATAAVSHPAVGVLCASPGFRPSPE